MFERVARSLDIDRPSFGERITWTVRTEHGVHAVELEQSVAGTRVRLDGRVVGHSPAWSFDHESYAFSIDGVAATVVVHADTRAGTIRSALLVNGTPVEPDVPVWRRRRHAIRWSRLLAGVGYASAASFLSAAVLGDPFRSWLVVALDIGLDTVWIALVRALDPLAILPAWLNAVTSGRAPMLLLGIELLAIVTLAQRPALRRRLPLLDSASRWRRALGWAVLAFVAWSLPLLLV